MPTKRSRVQGLAEANALFESLPVAAAHELGDIFGALGREIVSRQVARAPRDTGALRAALTYQNLIEALRLRAGLLAIGGKNGPWYGRVIEFGRRAQTVIVKRRRRGARSRRAAQIAATYKLRVRAANERVFIRINDEAAALAEPRLAEFWARTLARAEAGG